MPYYLVNKIGTGSKADKIRPDVDSGVSYVCGYGNDNKVIVMTDKTMSLKAGRLQIPPIAQLQDACAIRGLNFDDVLNKWFIKGG